MHYRGLTNTQKTASHDKKRKQFLNSAGNSQSIDLQRCAAIHPSSPPRLFCFRDSCNSPHWVCVPPSPLENSKAVPHSGPNPGVLCTPASSTQKYLPPLSSLFLSLFCLPRQLVTHAVNTFNSAREQDRNETGLLCWNMSVGVTYSAADDQRCLRLRLLQSHTWGSKGTQSSPFTFPAPSLLLGILMPAAVCETWEWLDVAFECHHATARLGSASKSLGREKPSTAPNT